MPAWTDNRLDTRFERLERQLADLAKAVAKLQELLAKERLRRV